MRLALLLVALLLATLAHAQTEKSAFQARFEKANRLFLVGHYREALKDFETLFLDSADPVLLFNIGQCHRLLGESSEAIRAYRNYLKQSPNVANRAEVEQTIEQLKHAPAAPAAPPPPPTTTTQPPTTVAPTPAPPPAAPPPPVTYVYGSPSVADLTQMERVRQARKARNRGMQEIVWGSIFAVAAVTLVGIAGWQASERRDKELGGHVLGPLIPGLVLGVAAIPLLVLGPRQYLKGKQAVREAEAAAR